MRLPAMKTFYTDRNGLVTLEDDVLSIVRQVRELYDGKVVIELDPDSGEYVFIENCEDGTERLIFTTEELDPRALERLLRADSRSRGYLDTYDQQEREWDETEAEQRQQFQDRLAEQGERMAHALKKDGVEDWMPLSVSVPRGVGE